MTDDARLRPVVPPGTYLADSRDGSGRKRALLFDIGTGALLGPPELIEIEGDNFEASDYEPKSSARPMTEDEQEALAVMIVTVAVILIAVTKLAIVGIRRGTPRVKRWWATIVGKFTRATEMTNTAVSRWLAPHLDISLAAASGAAAFADEMANALATYRDSMSTVETKQRQLAILTAEAYIADQRRKLAEAAIDDSEYFANLGATIERLQNREIPSTLTLAIESRPSSAADEARPVRYYSLPQYNHEPPDEEQLNRRSH